MNIAIVDDDPLQRTALHSWLEGAGHICNSYSSGDEFTNRANRGDHQLLIVDWEMPGLDGLELLGWLRSQQGDNTPVIFVTAHSREEDIVQALRNGADDYVIKPARRNELLARIEALGRRSASLTSPTFRNYGNLIVDTRRQEITLNNNPVELTQKEFSLASYLLDNCGKLLSRNELLEKVWGQSSNVHTRTVDTHISRLRKKLQLNSENGWHLGAVYQSGYRLDQLTS